MKRETVEKFINNCCTAEEAKQVIEWLGTAEGQRYLSEEISDEIAKMDHTQLKLLHSSVKSRRLYNNIQRRIGRENKKKHRKQQKLNYLLRFAVAAIVLVFSYVGYRQMQQSPKQKQQPEPEKIVYTTAENQQKKLTLSDGTMIRLNSNSSIQINPQYTSGNRSVTLEGEAYFSVKHNPDHPFMVHTGRSNIKVLGTSFNVRARAKSNNVQVTVAEGRVFFESNSPRKNEYSVYLEKGHFGILNLQTNLIKTDVFGISNYMSWIDGRFQFDKASFDEVCTQLERLYDIELQFDDSSIRHLSLTADFSMESLDKTLEVIALSLDLDYQKKGKEITWAYAGGSAQNPNIL